MKPAILSRRAEEEEEDMADYSSVAPPSSNAGGGMNDAFKDALQRARQVRRPVVLFIQGIISRVGGNWHVFALCVVTYGAGAC